MEVTVKQRRRRVISFIFLLVFLGVLVYFSISMGPEEIVNRIGVRNGYLVAFGVSFFAGFSAFTAVPYYSSLLAFLSGGLDPVILAFLTGISLSLGDMFLFYFGRKGRDIITGRLDKQIGRFSQFFEKPNRKKYIPVFAYLYMSFIPLPNDWLLFFLAAIRYPERRMYYIIPLGDITHACLITFLAVRGITLVV